MLTQTLRTRYRANEHLRKAQATFPGEEGLAGYSGAPVGIVAREVCW